jgi:hypothetical protein
MTIVPGALFDTTVVSFSGRDRVAVVPGGNAFSPGARGQKN